MPYTYKELCPLEQAGEGKLLLVREMTTGLLAVKRKADIAQLALYQRLMNIRHVNLMQILDVRREGEQCVVIAEYISGETLADRLRRDGVIPESLAVKYLMMLCDGVRMLHEHGIIHRDISPNNIMLTDDGLLKLCDYDISAFSEKKSGRDEEQRGTYGYAAPEQFGYAMTDEQTDIYAIGMIAYTMLGGSENKRNIQSGRLKRAIYRAVSVDKNKRYRSVEELQQEILPATGVYRDGREYGKMQPEEGRRSFIGRVPGFRTKTPWQMVTAVVLYPLLLYMNVLWMDHCLNHLLTFWFFIVVPWIFYLDLFQISSVFLKLDPGQKWFRLVVGLTIQMIGYFGGSAVWLM